MLRALTIWGLSLPTYLLCAALGVAAAAMWGAWHTRRLGVARAGFAVAFLVAVLGGVAGSKLWVSLLEQGSAGLVAARQSGYWLSGHSEIGGLLGGSFSLSILGRVSRIRIPTLLDAFAAPAALGLAIGRLGCLATGCCYGRSTLFPIALVYTDFDAPARPIGVPLHATPIYLSLAHLALFAAVVFRARSRRFPGELVLIFVAGYSTLRLLVEALRADPRGVLLELPLPVPVLGVAALTTATMLWLRRRRAASSQHSTM